MPYDLIPVRLRHSESGVSEAIVVTTPSKWRSKQKYKWKELISCMVKHLKCKTRLFSWIIYLFSSILYRSVKEIFLCIQSDRFVRYHYCFISFHRRDLFNFFYLVKIKQKWTRFSTRLLCNLHVSIKIIVCVCVLCGAQLESLVNVLRMYYNKSNERFLTLKKDHTNCV